MRPVSYGDLSRAARALGMVDPTKRYRFCRQLIHEADIADRYARRLGKLHPLFGRGTLGEAALLYPIAADPGFDEPDHCACVIMVLQQLRQRPRCLHL